MLSYFRLIHYCCRFYRKEDNVLFVYYQNYITSLISMNLLPNVHTDRCDVTGFCCQHHGFSLVANKHRNYADSADVLVYVKVRAFLYLRAHKAIIVAIFQVYGNYLVVPQRCIGKSLEIVEACFTVGCPCCFIAQPTVSKQFSIKPVSMSVLKSMLLLSTF